ncbi:MAG: transcription termination/antitermination protein NusA [Elusimicrobia bacterium]|nr:transcription termination/antitermination protein NusA [Elusimicrobiota bacterium]
MAVKSELTVALDQLESEKNIKKSEILKLMEGALASALRKQIGKLAQVEVSINPETAEITARMVKKVAEPVALPDQEMTLDEAKKIKSDAAMGENIHIPIEVDPGKLSRIAAQTAKQVLIQKIRETERDNIYEGYKPREGELINGSVSRFMDRNIIVDLGKTEGILPISEQIRKERYAAGERIRAVILKVDRAQRGSQIVLSRSCPLLLQRLLEMEVPEVNEKIVEIRHIVRDPGYRAKVTVISNDVKVDPVGACVGLRGSRIRTITNELSGERIDLINYSSDTMEFLKNSLSPAKPTHVRILDAEAKRAEIIVPDDQLPLAIGRDGQNVRLASQLTGWIIDLKTEKQKTQQNQEKDQKHTEDLIQLDGVGPKLASTLIKVGMHDIEKIAKATAEEMATLQGIGPKTAEKVIRSAKKYLEEAEKSKKSAPQKVKNAKKS